MRSSAFLGQGFGYAPSFILRYVGKGIRIGMLKVGSLTLWYLVVLSSVLSHQLQVLYRLQAFT